MMKTKILLVLALLVPAVGHAGPAPDDYRASIRAWRAERVADLKAPGGWLSLIGLHWLEPGSSRVGSAPSNDIVLNAGPAYVGTVHVKDGDVRFCPAGDSGVRVDGQRVECAVLIDDANGNPTRVTFGSVSLYLIERYGRLALRVKDLHAPARVHFQGLDYFPISKEWRIEGRFVPYEEPHTLKFPTVVGTVGTAPNPGRIVFEVNGEQYDLDVIRHPDSDDFFVIFGDRTNGKTTYTPGRFLHVAFPDENGHVIVDFNKAYNPPCVFTPYATCPLPPPQNRLDLKVTAGERMYHGPGH